MEEYSIILIKILLLIIFKQIFYKLRNFSVHIEVSQYCFNFLFILYISRGTRIEVPMSVNVTNISKTGTKLGGFKEQ